MTWSVTNQHGSRRLGFRLALPLLSFLFVLCNPGTGRGAESATPKRKLFIKEIKLGACLKELSEDALRAQIAEQIPTEILARRNMAYEDPSSYIPISEWSPKEFTARKKSHVWQRLTELDMKMMLILEINCLPKTSSGQQYLLSGKLMDLDRIDDLLTCKDREIRDGHAKCNGKTDVFDGISFAHVDMGGFSELKLSMQRLLSRLLEIPELQMTTKDHRFLPGSDIKLGFTVQRNEGRHRWHEPSQDGKGSKDRPLEYRVEVLNIDKENLGFLCKNFSNAPTANSPWIGRRWGLATSHVICIGRERLSDGSRGR